LDLAVSSSIQEEFAGSSLVSTKDVMNDTVTTESHGHPGNVVSSKARRNDRDQGNRISSGPAVISPHQQAGHMTEADQIVRSVQKGLANKGRPHMTFQVCGP
jgi:hypothetical protein